MKRKQQQQQAGKKAGKRAVTNRGSKAARGTPAPEIAVSISGAEPKRSGKPGPRMSPSMRGLLLKLLVAGIREGAINAVFRSLGYVPPASSALAY